MFNLRNLDCSKTNYLIWNPIKVALKQLCLALADLVLQMPQTNDYLLALLRPVCKHNFRLTLVSISPGI